MSLIIPNVYISNVVVSRDPAFFKSNQIKSVLIPARCLAQHFKGTISYLQFDLSDNPTSNIAKFFVEGIKFIHDNVTKQKSILVHCMGGVSRSVSMVICYIMFTQRLSFDDAFELVKKQRSKACPNPGFRTQLKLFEVCIEEYYKQMGPDYTGEIDIAVLHGLVTEHIQSKIFKPNPTSKPKAKPVKKATK